MKFIYKLLIVAFLVGVTNACDNTELDLQVNPNAITPEKASLNDLYSTVQLTFNGIFAGSQFVPGAAARMYHAAGFSYTSFHRPTNFNGLWINAYAGLYPDVDALEALSDVSVDGGGAAFDIHVGSAKIMKAYTMMILVDLLGDVPLLEAGQGTDVISPKLATGLEVYTAAKALLDEAIAQLSGTTATAPAFDNFYGGDPDKWITLANTIKLRMALNEGDAGTFNSLATGDVINDPSEDFQFNYGVNRTNPNSRHPQYNNHYETGDGAYLSNYFMWSLREEKVNALGITVIDPRIRYYFYRKIDDAFNQDGTTYSCHFTALPTQDPGASISHWDAIDPNLPFCVVADGYSGRDHLNGSGIPPDGPIRTSWGLYPFGGDFDDSTFDDTRESGTRGGLGAGISPILLSSFVDFMRAEAELTMNNNPGNARTLMESGIRASMAKVEGFEGLVSTKMNTEVELRSGEIGTIKDLFGMAEDGSDVDNYVTEVLAFYDAAGADQLDVVIKEFHIAVWGNGLEAYNMYKRTGKPANVQPGLEPSTGTASDPFPLSFFYPTTSESRNVNVDQKAGLDIRVFWNMGGPILR